MDESVAKPIAIGIPWYTRETYPDILNIMEDASTFPARFEDWLARAEATERQIENEGTAVVRAFIDPEEFSLWCRAHGLRVDAAARGRFASETALKALRNAH
jgi:hypothetical protein